MSVAGVQRQTQGCIFVEECGARWRVWGALHRNDSPVRITSTTSFSSESKPMPSCDHQIRHDHVAILAFPACAALPRSDDPSRRQTRPAAGRPFSCRVRPEYPGSDRVPAKAAPRSSYLSAAADSTRMIIGHRRGFDDDGGFVEMVHHRLAHFERACGRESTSTPRGSARFTGPETAPRARRGRRPPSRQRVAHFAARTIGEIAHRVERLLRGPGGDQHRLAFQVAAVYAPASAGPGDRARRSFPAPPAVPGPTIPQASTPSSGSTMTWPRSRRIRKILPRRRMVPHVGVHRRRKHHRSGERQIQWW